jgi:hypothetical protein
VPSGAEVYRELQQAEEEFDELLYNKQSDIVAISTDAIELECLYLGRFEIQLHVSALGEMRHDSAYRVVALDPQPSTRNSAVTHPHVRDERLCAGDAGTAIYTALASGRVCDFFLLVRSVLTTYDPDSPYVSIEDWHGTPCYECGYTTDPNEANWCRACEHDLCDDCSSYCRGCDETTCVGCLDNCEACRDPVCPSCMTECPKCGRLICKSCLDEALCPCLEEDKENEDESEGQGIPHREESPTDRTEAAA